MLCFALYSAERRIGHEYRELLSPWKLSYTQYLVLVALWSDGELTVGALGKLLGLDSGTLSPLLKRLERRDLLIRTRDEFDDRQVNVSLTDAGKELQLALAHIPTCLAEQLALTRETALTLLDQLHTVANSRPVTTNS